MFEGFSDVLLLEHFLLNIENLCMNSFFVFVVQNECNLWLLVKGWFSACHWCWCKSSGLLM